MRKVSGWIMRSLNYHLTGPVLISPRHNRQREVSQCCNTHNKRNQNEMEKGIVKKKQFQETRKTIESQYAKKRHKDKNNTTKKEVEEWQTRICKTKDPNLKNVQRKYF